MSSIRKYKSVKYISQAGYVQLIKKLDLAKIHMFK